MKLHRRSRVCLTGVFLAALALACDGGSSDAWVVEIDDGGVRVADLLRVTEERVEEEGAEHRSEILNEELERLVGEELALRRAKSLDIDISDDEVDQWLLRLHGPEYKTNDMAYRDEVRRQLALDRAAIIDLAEQAELAPDAVLNHFEEHLDDYRTPARIQIRQIVLQDPMRAGRLIDELNDGADFAEKARESSLAPEADKGGLLPPFSRGEMPEVFEHAFTLDVDEMSDVRESPYGYHIFLLVARLPAQEPELEDVREDIQAELQTQRLAELRRGWLRGLRKQSHIQLNERVLEKLR